MSRALYYRNSAVVELVEHVKYHVRNRSLSKPPCMLKTVSFYPWETSFPVLVSPANAKEKRPSSRERLKDLLDRFKCLSDKK